MAREIQHTFTHEEITRLHDSAPVEILERIDEVLTGDSRRLKVVLDSLDFAAETAQNLDRPAAGLRDEVLDLLRGSDPAAEKPKPT